MDSILIIVLGVKPGMAIKHNMEENSMRKTLLSTVGLVLALSMGATTAFAAGPGRGCNFVDTDGYGIRDNAGRMCIYVDADEDGICDNCGSYHWCGMTGSGRNFADVDGDGVCDHYGTGQGSGCGRGCQGGRENGFRGGRGR